MYSRAHYEELQSIDRGYFHTTEGQALRHFAEHFGIEIPFKNEICSYCDGEGSRALHGLVISPEYQDDHEFMEDYMSGKYDTKCEDCDGNRVVRVMDEERLGPDMLKEWRKWMRDVNSANAESLAEARMGA